MQTRRHPEATDTSCLLEGAAPAGIDQLRRAVAFQLSRTVGGRDLNRLAEGADRLCRMWRGLVREAGLLAGIIKELADGQRARATGLPATLAALTRLGEGLAFFLPGGAGACLPGCLVEFECRVTLAGEYFRRGVAELHADIAAGR